MNEYTIGYIACGSLVGLAVACLLYMMGGRNNKGIRRFGASFVIALTVNVASLLMNVWNGLLLVIYPLKIAEMSLGYGGHSGIPPFVQRGLITLASCVSGLMFCLAFGGNAWVLLPIQLAVGILTVFFSFKNPIFAAAEEPLVCVLNNIILLFYPFVVMQ